MNFYKMLIIPRDDAMEDNEAFLAVGRFIDISYLPLDAWGPQLYTWIID